MIIYMTISLFLHIWAVLKRTQLKLLLFSYAIFVECRVLVGFV